MNADRHDGGEPEQARVLREQLVRQLVQADVLHDARVEAAFREVPRHLFVPEASLERVYSDEAIATKREGGVPVSSSSQPAIMAIMLEQLALAPGMRVLEIGAGTGYNAALIARIVGPVGGVVTVDIDDDIVEAARSHLRAAGYERVQAVLGDGGLGFAERAPYDRIVLTVGAWDITPAWREQLAPGGRLVLPLSLNITQRSIAFDRVGDELVSRSVYDCGFMRLRGAFAGPPRQVQPLGPDEALLLTSEAGESLAAEPLYAALIGPAIETATGVRVLQREVFGGLFLWLALHERGYCGVSALASMADRGYVPCLLHWSGECASSGMVDGDSIALLAPPRASDGGPDPAERFDLFIRGYGARAAEVSRRLSQHVRDWDAAGRPASEGLRIRALPSQRDYTPAPDETVLDKRFTRLVLAWRG